jgi:bacillithiol biosynthesis deacetylase BshB1
MADEPLDILTFSPHPDDVELGCGGSLILAADAGLRVAIADLSEGEMASRGTSEQREREKQRAAALLGLCARFSMSLPDTEIGTDTAHRLPIIQLIREIRPRIVLAPYWSDRHPDHAAAGKLVQEACFFAGVSKIGEGYPHRPERVYYYMLHHPFTPSFVMDVSSVWERKMAAVAACGSQVQAEGSGLETALSRPEYLRFIEAQAIYYGAMIGAAYGEPFYSPGPVPLREFPGLTAPPPPHGELPPYSVYSS